MNLKIFFVFLLSAGISTASFGQDRSTGSGDSRRQERTDKIQQAKIAFLTEKLQLNSNQAEKFWPVYNQYEADRQQARSKSRLNKRADFTSLTDQQVRASINEMHANRQNELNIEKQYVDKFLRVISVKQLATLYRSEREFTRVLLKKLDDRRPHNKDGQ